MLNSISQYQNELLAQFSTEQGVHLGPLSSLERWLLIKLAEANSDILLTIEAESFIEYLLEEEEYKKQLIYDTY